MDYIFDPEIEMRMEEQILNDEAKILSMKRCIDSDEEDHDRRPTKCKRIMQEVPSDSEIANRIIKEVIPADEINVTLDEIAGLDEIKSYLHDSVVLPFSIPKLFKVGFKKEGCRGILLFGPHGTGKAMLAKAIAKEAGATFINAFTYINRYNEGGKYVGALFTQAAAMESPTIIFVNEVDYILGEKSTTGHEALFNIRNQFMSAWDQSLRRPYDKIVVIGATSRPFDLDEETIRRFEMRFMVGLPSLESRKRIFRTFLAEENVDETLDLEKLAEMTHGFPGVSLMDLCKNAVCSPIGDYIRQEKLNKMANKLTLKATHKREACNGHEEDGVFTIRPLNMEDFNRAKKHVCLPFAADVSPMDKLNEWNQIYGSGALFAKKNSIT